MTDTDQTDGRHATTARCLWCSAERPIDVDVCPACEHSWIDATIDEARAGKLDRLREANGASAAPKQPSGRHRWVLVALLAAVVGVYGAILLVDRSGTQPDTTVAATTTQASPATTSGAPAPTTAAPTTAAPTTTTTTSTTTTTTTTLVPIAIVEPAYDPGDLTLGAFALGPISFGNEDPDVVGRLAATFGQPVAILPADEDWGLCAGETGRVLEFGTLSVIMRETGDGEEFVGYRQRLKIDRLSDPDDPSGELRTISGLRLANRFSDAQNLYSRVVTSELSIQQDETLPPESPIYIVQRSSDGRTLIWGGLSNDDDPVIKSINSPNACDRGPTP